MRHWLLEPKIEYYLIDDSGDEEAFASFTDNEDDTLNIMPGQRLRGTGFTVHEFQNSDGSPRSDKHLSLTKSDVRRWKMAWRALTVFRSYHRFDRRALCRRCRDLPEWSSFDTYTPPSDAIVLGFSAVAFVYGGLHALAWSLNLGSPLQQLMWRISACVVMGDFPTYMILTKPIYKHYYDKYHERPE